MERELIERVVREVVAWAGRFPVPVTVSNRHVHLSREAVDLLFGRELTVRSYLRQPGQFAANETVRVLGPRGMLDSVRVVGPARRSCQVELSISDCYRIGVEPAIRDSGQHGGTPGVYLIGPRGILRLEEGVIVAQRHVHMAPEDAEAAGVGDGELVRIRHERGIRCGVLGGVLVRVSESYALECHLDVEEANALGVRNGDTVFLERGGI